MSTVAALTHAGAWVLPDVLPDLHALVQAAARTLPDTIYTKQVAEEPSTLARVGEVLRALMTLAIVVLTFAVVPAAWNFRKSYQKVSDLLDRVYADVNPITHHVSRIAENVDYVSSSVRADVQRVSATVADAQTRLERAVRRAEARARELEALIDVARAEAQDTFVSAASTVRGVRAGFAAFADDVHETRTRDLAARDRARAAAGPRGGRVEATVLGDDLDAPYANPDDRYDDRLYATLDEPDEASLDALALVDAHPAPRRAVRPPATDERPLHEGPHDGLHDALAEALDARWAEAADEVHAEGTAARDARPGPRLRPREAGWPAADDVPRASRRAEGVPRVPSEADEDLYDDYHELREAAGPLPEPASEAGDEPRPRVRPRRGGTTDA